MHAEDRLAAFEREFVRQTGERMRSCWIKTDDLPPEEIDGNVILVNLSRLSGTNAPTVLHYSTELGWYEDNGEEEFAIWDIADCSEWMPIVYLHEDRLPGTEEE